MVEKNSLLLIDLGYALFYRYSASQLWYKHSHPEEKAELTKDYKWSDNPEFMEKMKKMFVVDILTLAKKNKVQKNNIIIAEDCRLKDNWRTEIYPGYKAQRAVEREKAGWQGGNAFEVIYNEVIPEMVNVHGVIHLKSPSVEADDIISQIVIKCLENKKKCISKMIIVASDNDYFQILEDDVELINMKGVSQKDKMKYSPKGHLIEKILKGDVSDNIEACLFNKNLVKELVPGMPAKIKSTSDYIKANKKIIDYYIENPDELEKHIMANPEYIKGYTENKKLIAFSELPKEYIDSINLLYAF